MQAPAQSGGRRIHQDIPWWFRMIRERIANNRRGPWLMLRMADRLGLLKAAAWFPLGDARILIPLDWPSRIHLPNRLATYEPAAIAYLAHEIDSLTGNAVLIDCGADIGVYSRLVMQQTTKLQEVVLFEPNPQSYAILSRNFEAVGLPVRLFNAGVADFIGHAELLGADVNPHGGFIRRAASGIPVATIDSLELPAGSSVAVKIDVEGEELAVLQGAERTISQAREFVIQLEAAKAVAERTGQEPIDMLRYLNTLRPCRFTCFEEHTAAQHPVDLDRPFFAQFPQHYQVVDVAARSL
jgi:FkbM family methyltransferase